MNALQQLTNWKVIVALLLLQMGFSGLVFPHYQQQIDTIAGKPLQVLDLRMQYSQAEVIALLQQMQPTGRTILATVSGKVDMVYPLIYGLLLTLLLLRLSAPLPARYYRWLVLAPILAVGFDYVENSQILRMLRLFPEIPETLVAFSSLMTSLKWLSLGLAGLLLLILAGHRLATLLHPKSAA